MARGVELATVNPYQTDLLAKYLVEGTRVSLRQETCLMYPQFAYAGEADRCTDPSGKRWKCGRCPYLDSDLRIIGTLPGLVEVRQSQNIWHRKIPFGRWGFWINEDSSSVMMARIFMGETVLVVLPQGAEVRAKELEARGINIFELMTMAEARQSGGVIPPFFMTRAEFGRTIGLRSGGMEIVENDKGGVDGSGVNFGDFGGGLN